MGFLGCSLYSSATTGAVMGTILSIYGIVWTGYILGFLRGDITGKLVIKPVEWLHNDTNAITDISVMKDTVATSLSLHVIWLPVSLLFCYGNAKRIVSLVKIWVFITAIVVLTDCAGTGYYTYKTVNVARETNITKLEDLKRETPFLPYLIITILFSKLGILPFILFALMVYAWKRANAIKLEKWSLEGRGSFLNCSIDSPVYYNDIKKRTSYGLDNMAYSIPRVSEKQEYTNRPTYIMYPTVRESGVDNDFLADQTSRKYES